MKYEAWQKYLKDNMNIHFSPVFESEYLLHFKQQSLNNKYIYKLVSTLKLTCLYLFYLPHFRCTRKLVTCQPSKCIDYLAV